MPSPTRQPRKTIITNPGGRWLVLSAWAPELCELHRILGTRTKATRIVCDSVGVGLVESAIGSALAMAREKPDIVLFVGTAGLFPCQLSLLKVGDVVAARDIRLWSQEVAEGRAYFPMPLPATLKPAPRLRRLAARLGLSLADVISPLGINTHPAPPITPQPQVENLEAFAVGRAAARQRIPFAAILGISNLVGPAGHTQWKKHGRAAAAAACRAVLALIVAADRENMAHPDLP